MRLTSTAHRPASRRAHPEGEGAGGRRAHRQAGAHPEQQLHPVGHQQRRPGVQPAGDPPAPPASATPGNSQVALSWTAVTGATSYTVRWGTSSGRYTGMCDRHHRHQHHGGQPDQRHHRTSTWCRPSGAAAERQLQPGVGHAGSAPGLVEPGHRRGDAAGGQLSVSGGVVHRPRRRRRHLEHGGRVPVRLPAADRRRDHHRPGDLVHQPQQRQRQGRGDDPAKLERQLGARHGDHAPERHRHPGDGASSAPPPGSPRSPRPVRRPRSRAGCGWSGRARP